MSIAVSTMASPLSSAISSVTADATVATTVGGGRVSGFWERVGAEGVAVGIVVCDTSGVGGATVVFSRQPESKSATNVTNANNPACSLVRTSVCRIEER